MYRKHSSPASGKLEARQKWSESRRDKVKNTVRANKDRRRRRSAWGTKMGMNPNQTGPGGKTTLIGWRPPSWKQIKKSDSYKPGAMKQSGGGKAPNRPKDWGRNPWGKAPTNKTVTAIKDGKRVPPRSPGRKRKQMIAQAMKSEKKNTYAEKKNTYEAKGRGRG